MRRKKKRNSISVKDLSNAMVRMADYSKFANGGVFCLLRKFATIGYLNQLVVFVFACFLFSCNSDYTPKPKGYPRVIFPEKKYQTYSSEFCPFTFDYPQYADITRDTVFFDTVPDHPCWLNLYFPDFAATIYLSYKPITEKNSLATLINDAHRLTFKHAVKAEYIDELPISTANGVSGLFYDVGGNAASSIQFFLTDSTHHYLRCALYFNTESNADSLAPVLDFVKKDAWYMIRSLKWKE